MSLKMFRITREIRRHEHLFGLHKPGTLAVFKLMGRRFSRRFHRRELRDLDPRGTE